MVGGDREGFEVSAFAWRGREEIAMLTAEGRRWNAWWKEQDIKEWAKNLKLF